MSSTPNPNQDPTTPARKDAHFSEEFLRQIAREKVKKRFVLQIHALVYILANVLLGFLNFLFSPAVLWMPYALFGWGVGLAFHVATYVMYARGVSAVRTKGLVYHVLAYFIVNAFLFYINWQTGGASPYWWAFWPAGTWVVGVIVHLFVALRGTDESKKSHLDRAVEKELAKIKKKQGVE